MPFYKKILLLLNALCVLVPTALRGQNSCSVTLDGIELSWKRITNINRLKLPARRASAKLPRRYMVYTVDPSKLNWFLSAVKNKVNTQTEIVLPVSEQLGCRNFHVSSSGTLSPELARKFPQLVSLKGMAVQDKSATLRLNYDGNEMDAEVLWAGASYIIAPWKKGKQVYYLVYKKEDSGVEKKPFEEPKIKSSDR